MNISRRDLVKMGVGTGASMVLGWRPAFGQAPTLIRRPIPSTGEQIPVVGIGTNRFGVGTSVEERAPFLHEVPFLYESAKTGMRVRKVLDLILEVAAARETRVPTAEVNKVLEALIDRNQPAQKPGKEVKLLYASQVGTKPPTFAIVSNRPNVVSESYRRYIQNGFRSAFGFKGTPIRLKLRRKKGR